MNRHSLFVFGKKVFPSAFFLAAITLGFSTAANAGEGDGWAYNETVVESGKTYSSFLDVWASTADTSYTGTDIKVTSASTYGVYVATSNLSFLASATLTDSSVSVTGDGFGIYADYASAALDNTSVSTVGSGTNGFGVYAYVADVTLKNGSTVTTTGTSAYGIYAAYSDITLDGATVSTSGTNASAVYAVGVASFPTQVVLKDSTILTTTTTSGAHAVWAGADSHVIITGTTTIRATERASGLTFDAVAINGGVVEFSNNTPVPQASGLTLYAGAGGTLKISSGVTAAIRHVNLQNEGIFDISGASGDLTISTMYAQNGSAVVLGTNSLILDGSLGAAPDDAIQTAGTVTLYVSVDADGNYGSIQSMSGFRGSNIVVNLTVSDLLDPNQVVLGEILQAVGTLSFNDVSFVVNGVAVDGSGGVVDVNGVLFEKTDDSITSFRLMVVPEPSTYAIVGGILGMVCVVSLRRRKRS